MFDTSAGCTNPAFVKLRFLLVAFFVKMWLLNACFLLILPLPVIVNRFFALDLVFIFGISLQFLSYLYIASFIYFFFGLIIIVIRLPSSFGICSRTPSSANSCANFNNKISPLSLNTIVRPLKNT